MTSLRRDRVSLQFLAAKPERRNQAHIEKGAGDRLIVVKCYSLDRILMSQSDKKKKRRKSYCDQQVQQNRSDNSVIRDATSPEHGLFGCRITVFPSCPLQAACHPTSDSVFPPMTGTSTLE